MPRKNGLSVEIIDRRAQRRDRRARHGTRETHDRVDPDPARLMAQDRRGMRAEREEAEAQRQPQPPCHQQGAAFMADQLNHHADDRRPAVGRKIVRRQHPRARRQQRGMGKRQETEQNQNEPQAHGQLLGPQAVGADRSNRRGRGTRIHSATLTRPPGRIQTRVRLLGSYADSTTGVSASMMAAALVLRASKAMRTVPSDAPFSTVSTPLMPLRSRRIAAAFRVPAAKSRC